MLKNFQRPNWSSVMLNGVVMIMIAIILGFIAIPSANQAAIIKKESIDAVQSNQILNNTTEINILRQEVKGLATRKDLKEFKESIKQDVRESEERLKEYIKIIYNSGDKD